MDKGSSRRQFIKTFAAGAGALIPVYALTACGEKKLACTDVASLKPEEATARSGLQYMDASADPAKKCDGCQLFTSAGPDKCGSCSLVKGPINPNGSCTGFVKKG